MGSKNPSKKQMLAMAMRLAEEKSWQGLHLRDLATALHVELPVIHHVFRDKDDIIRAWFDHADDALIKASQGDDFKNLQARDRIKHLIFVWLDVLGTHKNVTKQMLGTQVEPSQIRIIFPVMNRLKRTVHWLMDAASIDDTTLLRASKETGLGSILVATFVCWLVDNSADSDKTDAFLTQALLMAEQSSNFVDGVRKTFDLRRWVANTERPN